MANADKIENDDKVDKVFKAYDIRGLYGSQIDEDLAWKIGHGTAKFLRSLLTGYDRGQAAANRLVIGQDMRPSSPALATNLMEGVLSSGLSCVDIGMVDTPMVYFAINHLNACGGVQVTASHNPVEYNGFKISGQKARPVGEDTGLKDVKVIVAKTPRTPPTDTRSTIQQLDLWDQYRAHVLKFLKPGRKLKIVVDASNGMAGKMIPAIFDGTELELVRINFEIGKGFAHQPNPLIAENLAQVRAAVVKEQADFGVCFDGDADRCMFVDEKGAIIPCDYVTAVLAKHFLRQNPGATIVYDLRSSRVVAEEIRAAGGVPRRERVGHAFMKKALADTRGVFGGELSGHFYFRDNFNCDSGAIVFAVMASVIAAQDGPLSALMAPLHRYEKSGEMNFKVPDKQKMMDALRQKYATGKADDLDGVTVQYDDWWFNVRPSNTEPFLRVNLEAKDALLLTQRVHEIESVLGKPVGE
jgi:phosphomannomutase